MNEQIAALVRKLQDEGEAIHARLSALTPEQWDAVVYTEGAPWSARDLLAHLVSAERGHQQLIRAVASGGPGVPADFDVDRYNATHVAQLADRPAAGLLVDLRRVRGDTITLVAALTDEDLARRGRHPALGEHTALADFIRIVFMHARLHLRDLNRTLAGA